MVKNFRIKVSCYYSIILLFSCNPNNGNGKHCAEVDYYNPKTGKQSNYTLKVQVEDGELTKIYWENGGWLDESHFDAPDISDGTATFTDDRGRVFEVELLNEDCE